MKYTDTLLWVILAGIGFTYYEGYQAFIKNSGQEAMGFSLCCGILMICLCKRIIKLHYLKMKMKKIDKLSGRAFERYLEIQFRHLGYRVKLTDFSHDYGADLVVKKRGEKIVVQAKRYEKNVGIAAIQEAVGSIAYYGADRAMVVTNSGFTKSAYNLARQNEVELWNRYDIQEKFKIK